MRNPRNLDRLLIAVAVVACLTFTFYVEHWFAADVLHVPGILAVAFPVALDAYVLAALRTGADQRWAFGLSALAQGVAGLAAWVPPGPAGQGALRSAVGVAVIVVLLRVHRVLHTMNRTTPAVPDRTVHPTTHQVPDRTPDRPRLVSVPAQDTRTRTTLPIIGPADGTTPDPSPGPTAPAVAGRVAELLPRARALAEEYTESTGRPPGQKRLAALLRDDGHTCSIDTAVTLLGIIRDDTTTRTETAHA